MNFYWGKYRNYFCYPQIFFGYILFFHHIITYYLFPDEAEVFFVGDVAGAHGAEVWGLELAVDEGAA